MTFHCTSRCNSHAKWFYREHCKRTSEVTVRLYEEENVLEALFGTQVFAKPETISRHISHDFGTPGDWFLLYTDKGLFWIQYVLLAGEGIPSSIALFDAHGNLLSDKPTFDYLTQLYSELGDFNKIDVTASIVSSVPPSLGIPRDIIMYPKNWTGYEDRMLCQCARDEERGNADTAETVQR